MTSSEQPITATLRENLLVGRSIACCGQDGIYQAAVQSRCESLGATVDHPNPSSLNTLVFDTSGFEGGQQELLGTMGRLWEQVKETANHHFIPANDGQLIVIAPVAQAGEHASALRAAVENLVRTLSIEWARYGIRTIAIWPGAATSPERVATLVAYLASPAGEYFSGCKLELDEL